MAIKLSSEQQKILAAGVLILGALGYVYTAFFWLPMSAKIKASDDQAAKVEGKIAEAQRQAGRLQKLRQELAQLNDQAREVEERLPKSKDVPDILLVLGKLAARHRIELRSFAPAAVTKKKYFDELNYTLSIRGGYHDVGWFFADVALAQRIFNIKDVVFTGGAAGELTVNFTLISYQYKG
ncbi:MAG: type 4a pilus biogenesis protein PilO [Elusimicrobia bacterium]|nr:type 4a pilus biogenesis protein PilO [Elusimicrobiota bacterium]MDE2238143.1 type 4a pilus biogenesis protein PilO [Elusimicrobiota bacterium]MDE2424352.1 type 4a pilus biogenesis protein PilO [Elusimicrobiota bacterium]